MTKDQQLPLIILDFDGVILESVDVKTRAFRELFSFSPDHVNDIVDFHIQNGGMSRFDKIRYIYKNIFKKPLADEQYDFLCSSFSELVFDGVLKSPFVNGAEDFLKDWSKKTLLFVVSATPESEIMNIIERKGLRNYFKDIYGSPRLKQECIEEILMNMNYNPKCAIFVGDALNDYRASNDVGVRFIGRVKTGHVNTFKGLKNIEVIVSDLADLDLYLEDFTC